MKKDTNTLPKSTVMAMPSNIKNSNVKKNIGKKTGRVKGKMNMNKSKSC